jgi:hypothetical protein
MANISGPDILANIYKAEIFANIYGARGISNHLLDQSSEQTLQSQRYVLAVIYKAI